MDTQRNEEFFYEIKKHLTPSRFYHSLNVAYEAYRLAGDCSGADLFNLFFEDDDCGFCRDYEPAQKHCKGNEQIICPSLGECRAENRAECRKADVHAREEQHET